MPIQEVLEARLSAHIKEYETHVKVHNEDRVMVISDMKEIRTSLENKVDFKHFYWVIGIMFALFSAEIGYVVMQNKEISFSSDQTRQDVSLIKGKLEPYNVEFTK